MLNAVLINLIAAALLVFPAVVAVTAIRRGSWISLVMVAALGGLAVAATGVTTGLSISLAFGGLGLGLWHFGKRPIRLEVFFGGLISIFLIGIAGVPYAGHALAGLGPVDLTFDLLHQFQQAFDSYLKLLQDSVSQEEVDQLQALQTAKGVWVWTFLKLMPSLLVVGATALVLVNFLLARHVLPALFGLQLNRWRAPDQAIWAVLLPAVGILPYLLGRMTQAPWDGQQMLFFSSLNLVIIALLPYMLQGLAVMAFFLERWRMPRVLRGLTYFLVLTQGLTAVVAALGLMEFWTDFRGRALAPKKADNDDAQ